jgi:uncharacterized protein with GYD domain
MAKYMLKVSYSSAGIKGVLAEGGTSRVETIGALIASAGGTMDYFHFAFGGTDVYVVADLPDTPTVVALVAAVGSSEAISAVETVVLIDPADIDSATSITVGYRPPGT